MKPTGQSGRRVRLARRQASIALGLSLLIGLVMAAVQVCIDYRNQVRGIDRQVSQLISSSSASATKSIWYLDKELAESITQGMLSHPLVRQVSIRTNNNVLMSEQTKSNSDVPNWSDQLTFLFGEEQVYSINLDHPENTTSDAIGTLTLRIDPRQVREEFSNRVLIIMLSGIGKALALGAALFILFYFTLSRPIKRYAKWVNQIDPKNPDSWNSSPPKRKQNDELSSFGKDLATRFKHAKDFFVELQEKRTELQQLNKKLEQRVLERTLELEELLAKTEILAQTDELTGLANRRSFLELAQARHAEWTRYQRGYALLMIDIDDFKRINDQYGHDMGDKVLVTVASILKSFTRKENLVARIGGEEFCILIAGDNPDDAQVLAERMRKTLASTSITIDDTYLEITASFGLLPPNFLQSSFEDGLKKADMMLYKAKSGGKNQVCVFGEVDASSGAQKDAVS